MALTVFLTATVVLGLCGWGLERGGVLAAASAFVGISAGLVWLGAGIFVLLDQAGRRC